MKDKMFNMVMLKWANLLELSLQKTKKIIFLWWTAIRKMTHEKIFSALLELFLLKKIVFVFYRASRPENIRNDHFFIRFDLMLLINFKECKIKVYRIVIKQKANTKSHNFNLVLFWVGNVPLMTFDLWRIKYLWSSFLR